MFREGGMGDAVVLIAAQSDPASTASAISAAINALYRLHHDISNMIAAAHLGVAWCLGQASLQLDPELAATLRRSARTMSFNAAANCWPGWDDEGVTIDQLQVEAALSLAGLCRELALDLELGPKAEGTAHWLIGALELALGRFTAARAGFQEAERSYSALSKEAPQKLMAKAYDALAAKYESPKSNAAIGALSDALESLRASAKDEAQFFAEQITTAERVFDARSI